MKKTRRQVHIYYRRSQSGVVLFVALIAMLVLTLAGISLLRAVDSNMSLAGNLALRQSAIASSDAGVNRATTWLLNQLAPNLWNDIWGSGYSSAMGFNDPVWSTAGAWPANRTVTFNDANGNVVSYQIFRLCSLANAAPNAATQTCNTAQGGAGGAGVGNSHGPTGTPFQGNLLLHYRIVVRVSGPKNTAAYVQVIIARGA